MILTTERLLLREFTENDWHTVFAYQSDPRYREQRDAGEKGATPVQWPGSITCHSNPRSSRMRAKLQLVMCSDEGHEETVTDVITLNKNNVSGHRH